MFAEFNPYWVAARKRLAARPHPTPWGVRLNAPGGNGWNSKSPRRYCSTEAATIFGSCTNFAIWTSKLQWTISEPNTLRSAISAACRSIGSRLTNPSSEMSIGARGKSQSHCQPWSDARNDNHCGRRRNTRSPRQDDRIWLRRGRGLFVQSPGSCFTCAGVTEIVQRWDAGCMSGPALAPGANPRTPAKISSRVLATRQSSIIKNTSAHFGGVLELFGPTRRDAAE